MAQIRKSAARLPVPTEAELAILQILWNRGPSTVREVHTALRSRGTGYTTALKQMQVMTEKGLLARSERFRSHVYEPRLPREQAQLQLTRNLLQRAFDGSAKNLVLGALSSQPISRSELAEIREMIEKFEKGKA
jgi:BlaI family penicillinase repressor